MKTFFLFLLLSLPFLTVAQQITPTQYKEEIARHRTHEDSVFKFDEHSPLSAEAKTHFKGLDYFPVEEAYRVKAKFERTAQEAIFRMSRTPEYVKYGELRFKLQGQPLKLSVYQNQELMKQPQYMSYLFIPFTDATTGRETYETGRYLDFTIPMGKDSIWLDFNKAYNPSCAYGDGYSCPIPPKENKLPVRVEAGVKSYRKEGKQDDTTAVKPIEILPEFPGGQKAMFAFMTRKFKPSKAVWKARINGKEIVSFIVEKDGTVSNVESVESLHLDIFAEVARVVGTMPKWKPGTQNGVPVPVKYTIPFKIIIGKQN
ncbi:DUF1684 domain-containing protein [Rufibacter tibetensis]|uniref:DUF1684 domain-containing protein n=1 Tax=Rufibacter tibetensis TaxID=512763 RepID=UPI0007828C28|nr:DUF1684 domain-containing protein [Rufibacter tibetensis]